MNFIRFAPAVKERVWGGRTLEHRLGRDLPIGKVIGESWEIVDRPEENSRVAGGDFDGWTLRELLQKESARIMGPSFDPSRPFPILVKLLDCRERLSLQVHPPAAIAPSLGGEPKNENWYILDADPGAAVLAGLTPGTTREAFEKALQDECLEPLVCRLPTAPGDSLFVESGRLHAIDAGNLILEIQQNSDTTYRVYDWGRVGLDGQPRRLHIDESLASIDFTDFAPSLLKTSSVPSLTLVDSPLFRLRKETVDTGDSLRIPAGQGPRILSVVSGALYDPTGEALIGYGESVLLPHNESFAFLADAPATVLLTENFVGC